MTIPAVAQPVPDAGRAEATRERTLSSLAVAAWLCGLVAASTVLYTLLANTVLAPTALTEELRFAKIAQSLGLDGNLALFGHEHASHPPLYSVLLAPVYALDLGGPTAYGWAKAVNAGLMSLTAVPIYFIARFAVPRREALLAAGVSLGAPLMLQTSYLTSANLAYPLSLLAVWATLSALRQPGFVRDCLVLTAILGATAARGELIVLLPAAPTAIGLAAVLGQESLRKEARRHWLLVLATGATTVYTVLQTPEVPDFRGFVDQLLWHAGALDLAVGVVPFVGTAVAAYAFFRAGFRSTHIEFAAVALSVTGWLWVAVAVASADASAPHLLHERYLISLVPLFVIALVATARLPDESPWPRVSLLAAAPAALLPLAIPFGRALDLTTIVDTVSLQPFARFDAGELRAAEHATHFALLTCAFFAVAYGVARRISTRALVLLTLVAFVSIDLQAKAHIRSASEIARATVPWHRDWVDSAAEGRDVALVADDVPAGVPTKSALTAFFNTSIVEVYTACDHTLGEGFGEQHVTVEPTGGLVTSTGPVRVTYAVVPWSWEFRGDVIATNQRGGQVLVRPVGGLLHAAPAGSGSESCAKASP